MHVVTICLTSFKNHDNIYYSHTFSFFLIKLIEKPTVRQVPLWDTSKPIVTTMQHPYETHVRLVPANQDNIHCVSRESPPGKRRVLKTPSL